MGSGSGRVGPDLDRRPVQLAVILSPLLPDRAGRRRVPGATSDNGLGRPVRKSSRAPVGPHSKAVIRSLAAFCTSLGETRLR